MSIIIEFLLQDSFIAYTFTKILSSCHKRMSIRLLWVFVWHLEHNKISLKLRDSEITTLHYTTLCTTLQYVLHYTALQYVLHYTQLHYTLYYTTLHYTTLHFTALCTALNKTTLCITLINSSLNGTKVGHWFCHPRIWNIIIMDSFRLHVLGMGP